MKFFDDDYDWDYSSKNLYEEAFVSLSSAPTISILSSTNVTSYPAGYVPYVNKKIEKYFTEKTRHSLTKLLGLNKVQNHCESVETIITLKDTEPSPSISSVNSSSLCITGITISDSQLKLNEIHNSCKIPEDPGLVPGFWVLFPRSPTYKNDTFKKIIDTIDGMKLPRSHEVDDMLISDRAIFQRCDLVTVFCDAFIYNESVDKLNFEDNYLNVDACCYLNSLLEKNAIILSLNLEGCKIGMAGAERLKKGIGFARSLEHLDLSGCELGSVGLKHIVAGVCLSNTLKTLNLSNNKLGETSAEELTRLLSKNFSIKKLVLARNLLFSQKFWEVFINGLVRSKSLSKLDMSCNYLEDDCATFLAKFIDTSTQILNLNLAGNLLKKTGAERIAKSLENSLALRILCLQNNPIGAAGALKIVSALLPENSPSLKLEFINLDTVSPTRVIIPVLNKIKESRPWLIIKLGKILGDYNSIFPDKRRIFLKRANIEALSSKKKKLKADFGQFVIQLEEIFVACATFRESIDRYKLKLSDSLVDEIINAFIIDKDFVDQKALKLCYLKEFPDTKLILPIEEKKKRKSITFPK
ncbi:uncharacterized protein LOC122854991 [Aphidius gifuensis]|uniref:uncharacterized protein LOC122854991 n=1 Tax=Aphidius gifuensis TaxID=684658 RepID=UPI001CDD125E|nr:uncharacterized protein LOC122854991 [Aphidius gifuensis]